MSRETLWATDPVAELLEDLQFTLNEGACMEAATTGNPVLVPDLRHGAESARWPIFAAAVIEQTPVAGAVRTAAAVGRGQPRGAGPVPDVPGGLSDVQWRDALAAVDTAALMMLGQRTDPGDDGGGWLDPALGHRAEIHQATGMVLVQLGISATDALARLRAHAFVHQRLLIDVARDVVARRLVFTPDMT